MKVTIDFNAWNNDEMSKAFLNFIGIQIPEGSEKGYPLYSFAKEYMDERNPTDPIVIRFLEEWLKDRSGENCYLEEIPKGLSWYLVPTDGPDYIHTFLEVTQEELLEGLSQEKVDLLRYCHGRIEVKGISPQLD